MAIALAVDIGGTKMAAGLVDEAGGLGARRQVPTPRTDEAEVLFAALDDLLRPLLDEAARDGGVTVCGVGCGGPMAAGGDAVSPLNIPAWRQFPLRDRLAGATDLPVFVDNDAKALALGEGWVGAAAGRDHFIAMVVSTGVGGGIVLDGRLLDGEAGNAGHIGHIVVEPGGRRCVCGAQGCLEAEVSGTAIAATTGADPADAPDEVRERAGRLVGRAVGSVCNLLDLRLAVVAGSVALGYADLFFGAAQRELDVVAQLDFARGAEIRQGALGPDGPLVGAAAVGWRGLGRPVLGSGSR